MGLAQGDALAEAVRAELARRGLPTRRSRWPSLRPLVSGALRGGGAGREFFRHFAHQAERLEGLAQAAGLPLDALVALQLGFRREAAVEGWFLRASRPVVGFGSLEIALPALVPALAGINEAGLVLVSSAGVRPSSADATAAHAPPILLVQDCLARFENLDGAIDWCRKRPVEGELVLELADASGETARIAFAGRAREIERGAGALRSELTCRVDRVGRGVEASWIRFDPRERSVHLEVETSAGEWVTVGTQRVAPSAHAD